MSRDECKWAIGGYRYPRYHKFLTMEDAEEFVETGAVPANAKSTPSKAGTKRDTSELDVKPEVGEAQDVDVVYVHGYGWTKDDGTGSESPIAELCGGLHGRADYTQRVDNGELSCVLETAPQSARPLKIVSTFKYATDCLNTWITRWLKNGFKGRNNAEIKNEGPMRTSARGGTRGRPREAKRGAQMAASDWAQLEVSVRVRIVGPPLGISRLESIAPAPCTPPRKKQKQCHGAAAAQAASAAPAPVHAALLSAMYSPRKMAILAEAEAILAAPPPLDPHWAAAAPLVFAAPLPPVFAAPPPRPSARHAPPPPIRPALTSLNYGQDADNKAMVLYDAGHRAPVDVKPARR
ncbi:hypothetical protein B0H10DRAFT_2217297 [Mycena sp. CBHHK59/15]|nr:hypothetical protein B0H10DRAFT_2217297 [Mycena sp. CBHHK59/15]